MTPDIYSLSLVPDGQGTLVKAAPAQPFGTVISVPSFLDHYRRRRAPTPAELLEEHLGTAWSCAQLNADLVACTTLRLYVQTRRREDDRRRAKRAREWGVLQPVSPKTVTRLKSNPVLSKQLAGAEEIEEVVEHPLLDLLNRPNPDEPLLSYYDLIHLVSEYLDTIGRAYFLVDRDGLGLPRRLWILAAHHVHEWSDLSSSRAIDRYDYGYGAQIQHFDPSEIVPFRFPDPADPYRGGRSPLRAVLEQVLIARKLDAHTGALLDNAGRPDAVFTPKGDDTGASIGESEATRLESRFRQKFAAAGRGGLLVLETPGALTPLTWPTRDIVDLEQARLTKEQICNAYGVPTTKLSRNDANLASAKTGDYAHARDAGRPRCMRIEAALNGSLVPMFDDTGRLFVAFDSPVPEDEEAAREDRKVLVSMGGLVINEERQRLGLPPIEGGDTRLVPSNLLPTDEAGKPIPHARQPAVGMPPGRTGSNPPSATGGAAAEPAAGIGQDLQVMQDTVLNGAQISAARQIVADVAAGEIPRDAGIGQLIVLFNLTPEKAEQIMGSAGRPDVPTTPNPKPQEAVEEPETDAPAPEGEQADQEEEPEEEAKSAESTDGPPAVIVREVARVEQEWVCPHCDQVIGEKETYAEEIEDGKAWRWYHRPCGGPIMLPPLSSELLPWVKEEQEKAAAAARQKAEGPHEYACVLAELPELLADEVLALAASIPDEDLAGDGREATPHVTVLYGLHSADPEAVKATLAGEGPITLTLGAVSLFEAPDETGADVVKLDVDSPDLHRLNQKLRQLEYTSTHPEYVPHVTLAYVRPGLGRKYAGDDTLTGRIVTIDRMVLSSAEGEKTEIPLAREPEAEQKAWAAGKRLVGDPNGIAPPLPQGEDLAGVLREIFHEQRLAVLEGLAGDKSIDGVETKETDPVPPSPPPPLPRLIPLTRWLEVLVSRAQPLIEIAIRRGIELAVSRLGVPADIFSVVDVNVPRAARELALEFAESTNATTSLQLEEARERLRQEIEEGIFQGDTGPEMRRRVEEVFDKAEAERAETIARTETSRALHGGEMMTAKESGVVKQKFLIASADACPVCLRVAAEGPKDLDEPYLNSGKDGPYAIAMTPPLHPNCQCSEGFVLKENSENSSEGEQS